MATGWSNERKARQRAAIYSWRPWEKSTGPKTKEGKARIGKNAWKHGARSRGAKRMRQMLREMTL